MSMNVLVTYASRAGSTKDVADAIGRTLVNQGLIVDIEAMQTVQSVSAYDAVVAGSAIRMDKWLPEALGFVETHQEALSQKPFAVFVVCLALAVQNKRRYDQALRTASGYLQPVRELVPTVSEGLFAGVLNLSKLPLIYRIPFTALTLTGLFKEGDYRDWDAINKWSRSVSSELLAMDISSYGKVS